MQHSYQQNPKVSVPRSQFSRSHGLKTTFDSQYLIPIYCDEALPGDTFNCNLSTFARLATPLKPIMDNMKIDTFFFAVPYRLLQTNWEKLHGAQDNPGDTVDYETPILDQTGTPDTFTVGTIYDYMGLPTDVPLDATTEINTYFFRAYNKIYNEWFRDENLVDSVTENVGDGPDLSTDYTLLKRGKRHDYFTSALPWLQKSEDGAVSLPIGTKAPVTGIGAHDQVYNTADQTVYETGASASTTYLDNKNAASDSVGQRVWIEEDPNNAGYPNIYADLSSATAATINQLREAIQVQSIYEKDARGGTRYVELIKAHFGVTSPDFRLQRSEYLGGGSQPINITPVPNMSATATEDQGDLAAYGTSSSSNHSFTKSFTEHCVILALCNVTCDLTYQQGIDKMFSRRTRFDYYLPSLSHLGEQEVLNQEIYFQGAAAPTSDIAVFGYQERHAEYRHKKSMITGQFRSTYSSSLDSWHLAQEFSSLPTLNQTFIEDAPPISRVVADAVAPEIILDAFFNIKTARPMPLYSIPGQFGRF